MSNEEVKEYFTIFFVFAPVFIFALVCLAWLFFANTTKKQEKDEHVGMFDW